MKKGQSSQDKWYDLEQKLRQMDINELSKRLNEANPNEFNLMMILLCRFATDQQIRSLYACVGSSANTKSYIIWQKKFNLFNPNFFEESRSYKLIIHQFEFHDILYYSLKECKLICKNILLFPGKAHLFHMPIPCLLKALRPLNCNLCIFRRKKNASLLISSSDYFNCINNDFKKITGESMNNATIMGSSSGGTYALLMGLNFDSKKIICVAPGRDQDNLFSKHFEVEHPSTDKAKNTNKILLIAAKNNERDNNRVNEISKIIQRSLYPNSVELVLVPNHKEHGLIQELAENGFNANKLLKSMFSEGIFTMEF